MNKLIWGVLAGIGIGMLLAPEKGSDLVKNLKKRFRDATGHAEDEAEDLLNKGKMAYSRATEKFDDSTNNADI